MNSKTTLEWLDRVISWRQAGINADRAKRMMEGAGYVDLDKNGNVKLATCQYHEFEEAWKLTQREEI